MKQHNQHFCFLLLVLECLITSCDYRVRYVPHPSQEESQEPQANDDNQKAGGFRLWSTGPNFDTELPQDVTGIVGHTAYLTCRVFDRTNSTVSWIRHSDLHILTVGRYTYTADNRYQSIYNPTTDEWILQIKYLQPRDSGMYECQVSTQPVRSFFVRLNILDEPPSKLDPFYSLEKESKETRAEIMGGTEVHVELGSTLNLTCVVRNTREKPHYLLWYHSNQTIDYTSPRGGISVVNSENENNSHEITSTLLIYQVKESDSGRYSCRPSNTELAGTRVYVIRDEHQQNLKSISNSASRQAPAQSLGLLLVFALQNIIIFQPWLAGGSQR